MAENRATGARQDAEVEVMHRLEAQAPVEHAHAKEKEHNVQEEATCAKEKAETEAKAKAWAEAEAKAIAWAEAEAKAKVWADEIGRASCRERV